MKKVLALLLVFGLLLTSYGTPVYALKDNYRVKISSTSSDILSGYYVEFDINGTKYRSDEMGNIFNTKMWGMLDEADRRKVMKTYAFAPWARKDQFGSDGSAAMCDYINEVTGWKQAAEVLRKRVEDKYCGELVEIYGNNGANKDAFLELCPEVGSILSSPRSDVRHEELKQKIAAMGLLYDYGLQAYNCLLNIRYQCTQMSVKAISGDLIQIITDKALVPNITPAGSGSAITSIATNIFDLVNSLTGATDKLSDKVIGKKASSADVAEMVTSLSQIADGDYQIALNAKNQIEQLKAEINAEAPILYATLDDHSEAVQKQIDDARDSYKIFKEEDPAANSSLSSSWDSRCPKPPTQPKKENYSTDEDYEAAMKVYNQNYEVYEVNFGNYINSAQTTLQSYSSEIEALRDQAVEFCDTYYDRYPRYQPVYDDEPWMITSYMPSITADDNTVKKYDEVAARRIDYNEEFIDVREGIIDDAQEMLKAIENTYPPIVSNARGVCEGVNKHYYIGEYSYDADYVTDYLESIIVWGYEDIERLQKENIFIDETMSNYHKDRKIWLDACRKKAAAYLEAQNNYILAAVYYDTAFSNATSLIDGLPDYVKDQRINGETTSGSQYLIEYLQFSRTDNPTLYYMLAGLTPAQRDAECKRLGSELKTKFREYLKYQRQMKAAQNYMAAYKETILNNEIFGNAPDGFAKNYEGIGAGLMPYTEIFSMGKTRYMTNSQRADAVALKLLANDLTYKGDAHANMELLYSEIKDAKAKILRNYDYDLYRQYSSNYSSIISNARYYSASEFGEDDKYAKKVRELLDDIYEKLDGDFTPVDRIEKKGTVTLNSADTADVIIKEAQSAQLSVSVYPSDATEKEIVWGSSDPDVADVDENGVVTGMSVGEAVITAYAFDSTRTPVYETDESGEQVLNDAGKPILKGYTYDPAAVTFTVSVTENPNKPPAFEEPAAKGFLWQNFGAHSTPSYVKTECEDGTVSITANLRTQGAENGKVFFAVYNADKKLVGLSSKDVSGISGDYEITVSCPDSADPFTAKVFIFGSTAALNPLSAVPFTEFVIY